MGVNKRVAFMVRDGDNDKVPGLLRPVDWCQVTAGPITGWEPRIGLWQWDEYATPTFGAVAFDPSDEMSRIDEIQVISDISTMMNATDGTIGGNLLPRTGR